MKKPGSVLLAILGCLVVVTGLVFLWIAQSGIVSFRLYGNFAP